MTKLQTGHNAGLHVRKQYSADAAATVDVGAHAPSDVWYEIATSEAFQAHLVDAVRELLAGVPHHDRVQTLREAGITAGEDGYARLLTGLERAPETPVHERALSITAQFGRGEVTPLGHRFDLADLVDGPLALLDAADDVPTVAVRVDETFRERRREQREATCRLLTLLGTVCDVTVVASPLSARWLAREHGEQFPTSFSEQCNAGRQTEVPLAERADAARDRLEHDGRAVRLLRNLAAEPGETLSYHELTAMHDVSDGRISQLVSTLEDLDLVERFGSQQTRRVTLLPAGNTYLETLDEEIGRQQALDELFNQSGQSGHSDVYSRPRTKAPPDASADEPPGEMAAEPYRTRYFDRADHAGAAGTASDGDIVAVEAPIPDADAEERHTRYVSYDDSRDEVVVAVHATTPLQYMVSVALGLASPRLFDEALPPRRLDDVDDPPTILRDARCIGGLSAETVDDGEALRDRLVEWGEDLAEMTTKLQHGEYEDRDRFCGEILRTAHGLAGTIIHLLDVVGADIVRELRVPSLGHGQMEQLARTVAVATSIQSKYGAFTAYRQLFEDRDEKRQTALSPEVDADSPFGSYIGSLVIRGPRAHRLGYHVEGALSTPADVHEDAPEFAVRVDVTTPGRPAYTAAMNRMLTTKNIRATPEAVTLFEALTGDVYAVTEALHWLGSEEQARTIRLDEVRVALATLDADQLLPNAPPSVSKAVGALLRSSRPLSKTALAEKADVSTRSLRRHLDALVALDLVRETEDGYRLTLPFQETERGEQIAPTAVTDETTSAQDLVFELTLALVEPGEAGRLGDPSDPLGKPFFGPTLDTGPLERHLPDADPYLSVALTLCNRRQSRTSTVEFGPDIEQTSLEAASTGGVAA